ncbi:MAG: hypothetical protein WB524_14650 [Acidobacteriaceae bacterium]|jgi:hypothetical protein
MQAADGYSQYALKDLHQEIDLVDRKINYSKTYETFSSEDAREAALRKLATKRGTLVKAALALANSGVQCDARFLPRSFIHAVEAEGETQVPEVAKSGGTVRAKRTRR